MGTIAILADIISPKDEISGSASEAKVPEFIEFIVKDMPNHQIPMRGGLRWLDMQCLNRHGKAFTDCTHEQQIELVGHYAEQTLETEYERVKIRHQLAEARNAIAVLGTQSGEEPQ